VSFFHVVSCDELKVAYGIKLTQKGTYSAPFIIPSELHWFKRGHSEHLSNHGAFDVLIAGSVDHQSVKNLKHFGAVASIPKLSDCGFVGHDFREKSVWVKV
jgi:hypothetical protein